MSEIEQRTIANDRVNSTTSPSYNKTGVVTFKTASLFWLALGTFATGTESFMIAPLLPDLASDLSVSVTTAGLLITVFALTYAISSPILTALTGGVDRFWLLVFSMSGFAVANFIAYTAPGYGALMIARILLAVAAGLYVPNANALAGALVAPEKRGRALAIVTGGTTIAIAFGVPLGSILGYGFGWRTTFAGVGILAGAAALGLYTGLPRDVGTAIPVASIGERVAVIRQSEILLALLVTTFWALGNYTIYSYLAPFLAAATGISGANISAVSFLWGITAAVGLLAGGFLSDRFGPRRILILSLLLLAAAFGSLWTIASLFPKSDAIVPVLVATATWGIAGWAFFPAQQLRLIALAGLKTASIALSLNASFMYLGFSLGAVLGSFVLDYGTAADLGWVSGVCELVALSLLVWITQRAARSPE